MVQPESDEALIRRLLPSANPDPQDRATAWAEWHLALGGPAVLKFIRGSNNTGEADEDILQDALMTAYLEVERGRYQQRAGVPFTAYVKGIARNKIREARRRGRHWDALDESEHLPPETSARALEASLEYQEERRALRRGLQRLPQRRRMVLEAYLRGESLGEIAIRLQMSEASVRQHKHRGLRSLQQLCDVH